MLDYRIVCDNNNNNKGCYKLTGYILHNNFENIIFYYLIYINICEKWNI